MPAATSFLRNLTFPRFNPPRFNKVHSAQRQPTPQPFTATRPFHPLLRNGHAQTIVARYWPAPLDESRWPTQPRLFRTEPDAQVLAHENRQPANQQRQTPARGTIVSIHGLAASSDAPYMRRLAQSALAAGFNVVRLNVRNCGGTETLTPTLYHSGLTVDLRRVIEQLAPEPLCVIGFSMGGNLALKLAGEWGEDAPPHVRGVCGISVPIQLGACSRRLGEPRNRVYELRFLWALRKTFLLKQRLLPSRFGSLSVDGLQSIYDFDDRITAPAFGFQDAEDYYTHASSAAFLGRIRRPALLIQADDDPFIPRDVYDDPVFERNPYLSLLRTSHGGHVAFLGKGQPRFWAAEQALSFCSNLIAGNLPMNP